MSQQLGVQVLHCAAFLIKIGTWKTPPQVDGVRSKGKCRPIDDTIIVMNHHHCDHQNLLCRMYWQRSWTSSPFLTGSSSISASKTS
jgi:hypothetical protein